MNSQDRPHHFLPIVILCLSLFVAIPSGAQLNSGNFTQFSEKDGLPGVQVNDVLIDRLGYVWTGTVNGLARYDGYGFKRFYFNPNDTNTIHGLIVWSLFEDGKGHIWTATSPAFLNEYNPVTQTFRQYKFTHLIRHADNIELVVRNMCEDDKGRLYFGIDTYYGDTITNTLLYKDKNDDELKVVPVDDSLHLMNIYKITKDHKGIIWILSVNGVFTIDAKGKTSRFRMLDKEFLSQKDFPWDINFDKQGHAWMVTQNTKLYDIDPSSGAFKMWFSKELYHTNERNWIPKKIIFDREDNIWIGTNGGLQFFNRNTGKFSMFTSGTKKELERIHIIDLSFDSFGTLWLGTDANGLVKYEERSLLKSYSFNNDKNSLTQGWANIIHETKDGRIMIATGGSDVYSGINFLDPRTGSIKKITYRQIQNRINGVSAVWEESPGEFNLGVYSGIYRFTEKNLSLSKIELPGLPPTIYVTNYLKDTRGNEWICSFTGLFKKEKGAQSYMRLDLSGIKGSNASSNEITQAIESKKNGLWLLTNNGLFFYNYSTDKIERHGSDKSAGDIFITPDVNSLYEESDSAIWVGTWQGGLSKYNPATKKIKSFTREDGLPSMSIQSILGDEKNHTLWLSTFEGLSRFNIKTEQFNNFSIADGIQGQLFADGSSLKTTSGLFVFGGSNGITVFNPDEVNKNSIPPKVFLTDLRLFNKSILPGDNSVLKKPIYETDKITLAHNQNNLSIEFLALHFSNPQQNKYSYKLENFDNEWRDVGNQHMAFYPNLPPGEYAFHVKAANDKGVWNEKGTLLKIIVSPPWWKTTGAYITYGLLLLALGFAVDRYVRRRLVQKEREKNRVRELEQAKEIEKAYHKLEQSHEALKATQSQLVHSEKMASLGELTAGIAHEIQNPLNFVNNFSEVNKELVDELRTELETGNMEQAIEIANNIKENETKINHHGKRADAIVKSMLQHSRSSSGQKELTDINALADEYLRLAYHGLRAKDKSFNAKFETDFDNSIGKVNIIPQDMGRVLVNLINNAFYAVGEKKKLSSNGYEPRVNIRTKNLNNKVEIRIKDNGSGIPQKVLDKIFQPFFTTKPSGQGTGLGLSLSYDIITKGHSGEMKVETKEGQGAEFIVLLPK